MVFVERVGFGLERNELKMKNETEEKEFVGPEMKQRETLLEADQLVVSVEKLY